MSAAINLVKAVLLETAATDDAAQHIVDRAADLGVDVLDYCARRFELSGEVVLERSASWAGFAFSPVVPRTVTGSSEFRRLNLLAEVRTLRARLFDREVSYLAPRFDEMLLLKQRLSEKPEIVREICIVPPGAIRRELAD